MEIILTSNIKNIIDLNNIDFSKQISQIITFNSKQYKFDNQIKYTIVSADIISTTLYNTQRYITQQQLKNYFSYSSNIQLSSVQLKYSSNIQLNYDEKNNENISKIKLDSLQPIILQLSTYVNYPNNTYFLNSGQCIINPYKIQAKIFPNINIILPLNDTFNINLSKYVQITTNEFKDLISTFIFLNIDENSIISSSIPSFNNINYLSGQFNISSKNLINNYWENKNQQCQISAKLQYNYKNLQLDKIYTILSAGANESKAFCSSNINLYIVDAKLNDQIIWLNKLNNELNIELIYEKYSNKESIFDDKIIFYGTSNFENKNIISQLKAYFYDQYNKKYIEKEFLSNIDKLNLTIQSISNNTHIINHNIDIYFYTHQEIENKNFYYLSSIDKSELNLLDQIILYNDNGLTNILSPSTITLSKNEDKEINIKLYKKNISGIQYLVCSSMYITHPVNVWNEYSAKYIDYNNQNILSGLYTFNNNVIFSQNLLYDNTQFIVTSELNIQEDLYYLNLKVISINKLLDTSNFNISAEIIYKEDILYQNENQNQVISTKTHSLSTIIYDINVYGQLFNLSKSNYILFTKSNILSGIYLKNNDPYILDICSGINIEIDKNYACIENNIDFNWLNYNEFTNIINGKIQNYNDFENCLKKIKLNNYIYKFKNGVTEEQISYKLKYKDLFKFPGIKEYPLKFNDIEIGNISSNNQLYEMKFELSANTDINKLNLNNYIINFNTYYLNLPAQSNIIKEQILQNINTQIIKDKISNIINTNQLSIYNISGSFFTYTIHKNISNEIIGTTLKHNIKEFGSYYTLLNIYPTNIIYKDNIIQNYDKFNLKLNIIPLNYNINQNNISEIYYGQNQYSGYGKIQIGNIKKDSLLDISKIFLNSNNILIDKYKIQKQINKIQKIKNNILIKKQILQDLPIRIYFKTKKQYFAILDIQKI